MYLSTHHQKLEWEEVNTTTLQKKAAIEKSHEVQKTTGQYFQEIWSRASFGGGKSAVIDQRCEEESYKRGW
jgi:hypothetical protein